MLMEKFDALEKKVHQVLENLRAAGEELKALKEENSRLKESPAAGAESGAETQVLRKELKSVINEREEIKTRVDQILKDLDAF